MQKYKADQTGPKIQLGGLQLGFVRVAYQVAIFGVVTAAPMPAAAKQTARKTRRPSQGCVGCVVCNGAFLSHRSGLNDYFRFTEPMLMGPGPLAMMNSIAPIIDRFFMNWTICSCWAFASEIAQKLWK